MTFYKKELMDHYRNPRNNLQLSKITIFSNEFDPSCGDHVELQLYIVNDIIEEISFVTKGCIISQASASMLSEQCIGKSLENLMTYDSSFMLKLIGLELGPTRLKCALLPLEALKKIIKDNILG